MRIRMSKDEFRERMLADRELRKAKTSTKDRYNPYLAYRKSQSAKYLREQIRNRSRGR